MSTVRANFGELLWPGLKHLWGLAYNAYEPEFTQMFDVETSDKAYEMSLGLKTFGQFTKKTEGASITFADPAQSYVGTITHDTYACGFIVSREMVEDDQYNTINKLPGSLATSANYTVETNAQNILNNAFTSGTGPDANYLCAADHALKGGGTGSNVLSTAADLSITSYKQALIDIAAFKDDAGKKVKVIAKKLIVPADLQFEAMQILKSPGLPKSADNDINPVMNSTELVVGHFLTDTDAWFIRTDCKGLVFFWRRRPEFERDNDFDAENAKFKSTYRCSQGWYDWRAIYGTAGA